MKVGVAFAGLLMAAAGLIATGVLPAQAIDRPINKRDLQSLEDWQRAIKSDDKGWVIKHSAPPIELSTCPNDKEATRHIGDEIAHQNWIADYDGVMTQDVKDAILAAQPTDLVKDYSGMSIQKGNLVVWFYGDTDYENDIPFKGYQLQSITNWSRETCAGVPLDPRFNDGPVPVTIQGVWAEGGACMDGEKRMVLKTNTVQLGTRAPQQVLNFRHSGPRGAFRSFDLGIEGDVANFVYDPDDLQQIDVLDGWSSQAGNTSLPYRRCPTR